MRPSVTKSKLFVLALLLAFLSSALPSLAAQKSAFMRVYDLKAGHSNRGECAGNPINHIDPSGLQEQDPLDARTWNATPSSEQFRDQYRDPNSRGNFRQGLDDTQRFIIFGIEIYGPGKAFKFYNKWRKARKAAKAAKAAKAVKAANRAASNWNLGAFKSQKKWQNQFKKRGWTAEQVTQAIRDGTSFTAKNNVNKANSATRFVHPGTGRSVIIDNVTKEILMVGGDGFLF